MAELECNEDYSTEITKWKPWFAWYPVRLDTGKWRWLVRVGRKYEVYSITRTRYLQKLILCGKFKYRSLFLIDFNNNPCSELVQFSIDNAKRKNNAIPSHSNGGCTFYGP